MLRIKWLTCGDDSHWCNFDTLDLTKLRNVGGVYVIWHQGDPPRTVRVGQTANFAERFGAHRNDPEITRYRQAGTLRVTWAVVPAAQRDGAECYLADQLGPLVGDAFPTATAIPVNLPW